MKSWPIFKENLRLYFSLTLPIFLGMTVHLLSQGTGIQAQTIAHHEEYHHLSANPLYEVATLGAPTTGSLIEGVVGSLNKGCRQRFYCHSSVPQEGFVGPQTSVKPLSIKDQPGVYPAPLMGPASLTFQFTCPNPDVCLTPIVVRPDGTIFKGLPMTAHASSQTLEISSPAQTGIYTLFVLANRKESQGAQVIVDAAVSTEPEQKTSFQIKSFEPSGEDETLISAEFVYTPAQ